MADAVSIIAPKPRRLSQEPEGVVSCRRKDKEGNYDEKKKKEMELVVEEEVDNLRQLVGDNTFLWACGGRHGEPPFGPFWVAGWWVAFLQFLMLGALMQVAINSYPAHDFSALRHKVVDKVSVICTNMKAKDVTGFSDQVGNEALSDYSIPVCEKRHIKASAVFFAVVIYMGTGLSDVTRGVPLLFGLHAEHLNKPHPSQYVEKCKRLVGFAFLCRFMLAFATVIVVFKFSNVEYFDIVVDVVAIRFIVDLSQCKYMVFVAHPRILASQYMYQLTISVLRYGLTALIFDVHAQPACYIYRS